MVMSMSRSKNTGFVKLKITTHITKAEDKEIEQIVLYGGGGKGLDEWVDRKIAKRIAAQKPMPTVTPKWLRPRCGAKTRTGKPCQALAVWDKVKDKPRNGRCRIHGGLSSGAKTEEGRRRSLQNLKQYCSKGQA